MHTQSETTDANRAQAVHLNQMATFWRELVVSNQKRLDDANLDDTARSAAVEDLEFNQTMLAAAEKDAATAKSALDAVPKFVDDEKTAPRLVLVHSAEPVVGNVAEHEKPDDDARAWCGTLLDQHTSKCVDCHDRMLERAVLAMGGSDNSVFHTGRDGQVRKTYLYLPNAELVVAGFVCTWPARGSLTSALLEYIRGHRDWGNRMHGEVQS